MYSDSANDGSLRDQLRRVLLDYLQPRLAVVWPGADGLTDEDALGFYPQARASGHVPDVDELCRRHPNLVGEIRSLFARKG